MRLLFRQLTTFEIDNTLLLKKKGESPGKSFEAFNFFWPPMGLREFSITGSQKGVERLNKMLTC